MGKNIIGYRLQLYRAMQNPPLMQADLLARLQTNGLDISQPTLSKIENLDRQVADFELLIIAKALKVDVMWLLGEKETTI